MSRLLRHLLIQFLEEIQSLVDADDGTVFQVQHIEMLDELIGLVDKEDSDG